MKKANEIESPGRRKFLGTLGAATVVAGAIGLEPAIGTREAMAAAVGTESNQRRNKAAKLRIDMAQENRQNTPPNLDHPTNPDDVSYADKCGSYSKGLPHNADGTVNLAAYASLVNALANGEGNPALFDAIQISDGSSFPFGGRKLTNPQAGIAFEVEGRDAQSYVMPPAPAFNSREEAAEIAENYWMALLRDVPFSEYPTNPIAIAAAADLTAFGADFKGPKNGSGVVTPQLLFRGVTPGCKTGPWVSQFFYQSCAFGSNDISQKTHTLLPLGSGGKDYMTRYSDWLNVQNGANPLHPSQVDGRSGGAEIVTIDPTLRYMRTGRDLSQWVHNDVLFQGYFQALLVLFGLGAPLNPGNPYNNNPTQDGFGTFGGPYFATVLAEVSTRALHAVWYQKWHVHRRLRPEAFAGRIEYNRTNPGRFDVHPAIAGSSALPAVFAHNEAINGSGQGTYLLPMAFPEGSPTHPAYGAGHATVAGACTTILKALFNGNTPISSLAQPMDSTPDGLSLVPYAGADAGQLTVNGEIEKIAYNVANGRNIAGVHWRSDSFASIVLGEQIAMSVLREQRAMCNEAFAGYTFKKFDGTTVTV